MAELFIQGIKLNVRVGVYEHEKNKPQPILVDCKLRVDESHSEDLSSVVDYESLIKEITSSIEPQTFNLVETLTDRIYDICAKYTNWVEVSVTKNYLTYKVSYKRCTSN